MPSAVFAAQYFPPATPLRPDILVATRVRSNEVTYTAAGIHWCSRRCDHCVAADGEHTAAAYDCSDRNLYHPQDLRFGRPRTFVFRRQGIPTRLARARLCVR